MGAYPVGSETESFFAYKLRRGPQMSKYRLQGDVLLFVRVCRCKRIYRYGRSCRSLVLASNPSRQIGQSPDGADVRLSCVVVPELGHCRPYVPILLPPESNRHGVGIAKMSLVGFGYNLSAFPKLIVVHPDHRRLNTISNV